MRSQECFLYPDPERSEQNLYHSASEILIKDRKRFKIDLSRECFDDVYRDLWIDWDWNRGSIVWMHAIDEQLFASVFAHCFDPIAMENPSVYLGKNVVTLARSRVSESQKVCLALPNGIEQLFLFASKNDIGALYDLALDKCRFTEKFQMCYGT